MVVAKLERSREGPPSAQVPSVQDSPALQARQAGLRYVSDAEPGIRRLRVGRGFRYVGPERRVDPRARGAATHSWAGYSARLDRRLDLSIGARPHTGDGPRRQGPQAVPLPRDVADGPRRDEVRTTGCLRRRPTRLAAASRRGSGAPRSTPREGAGNGGRAARHDVHPDWKRRICAPERLVRADHSADQTRRSGRQHRALPLPREVWQTPRRARAGSAGGEDRSSAASRCPASSSFSTWTRKGNRRRSAREM